MWRAKYKALSNLHILIPIFFSEFLVFSSFFQMFNTNPLAISIESDRLRWNTKIMLSMLSYYFVFTVFSRKGVNIGFFKYGSEKYFPAKIREIITKILLFHDI